MDEEVSARIGPGDHARLVVRTFGTFDVDRHPRVGILEEGLRAHGFRVVRCNVPWNASTAERVAALRRPWLGVRLLARLLASWLKLARHARRAEDTDIVIVGYLGVLDVHLARLLWRTSPLALDHLAPAAGILDDRLGGRGVRATLAAAVDRAATRRADLIMVDTEEHLSKDGGEREVVVPVGAQRVWFEARPPREPSSDEPLSVVFFGLFTPLHGSVVLATALRQLHDAVVPVRATMIGSGQDLGRVRAILDGVTGIDWRPWVEPRQLPSVVAGHDVCLGIFGTTPKAARVVPNKVFQGAAAGCAVVTSDTAPQRRALGSAGVFVPPGHASGLAAALAELAEDDARLLTARQAAAARADAAFTPEAVVDPLLERLWALVES